MPHLTQDLLARPLDLPCGMRLKNRLVKAAMSDGFGDGTGQPGPGQARLYARWARGGAGLALIGEVQVDPRHAEAPGNLVLVPGRDLSALRDIARAGQVDGARIWPQLGHAGALTDPAIGQPRGPSALRQAGLSCMAMTRDEIAALPGLYAQAALRARAAGFDGVQVHAAHGFLLSQFLSPLMNRRGDDYGGDLAGRFRLLGEVLAAIRAALGPHFALSVKVNATDQLEGGLCADQALEVVARLDAAGLDLVEISGGSYVPGARPSSEGRAQSGAYFADFARAARGRLRAPLMLTGGIRSRAEAVRLLRSGVVDAVGLARALVLCPDLPAAWLRGDDREADFPRFADSPPGGVTAWYQARLRALGGGAGAETPEAALEAQARAAARLARRWRAQFGA